MDNLIPAITINLNGDDIGLHVVKEVTSEGDYLIATSNNGVWTVKDTDGVEVTKNLESLIVEYLKNHIHILVTSVVFQLRELNHE